MPSFYLVYPALAQRIEFLRNLSIQSCSPTCVIGDHGSGKSALLTYLRQNLLEHNAIVIAMETAAGIKHKQFLARIGKELEPHCRHEAIKSPQQVQKNLIQLSTQDGGLYLLFDDADTLPLTAIEFLFRCFVKAKNQGGRLGMFFFGGPVMKQQLERSKAGAIKSLPAQFVHIPRLCRDDVAEFLKMWSHAHGVSPEPLVNARLIDAIYRESGALPGAINDCVPQILNRTKSDRTSFPVALSSRMRNQLFAAALVAVAGGALLVSKIHRSSTTENLDSESTPPPFDRPTPTVESMPVATAITSQPLHEPETNPLAPLRDESAPATQSLVTVNTSSAAGRVKDDAWLQGQNPRNFTIQLMATSHKKNLLEVAHRYTDLQPLAFIRSERRGKAWFVLVVGTYASYAEANGALSHLPEELQQNGPWIRSVSSVQGIISPPHD